MKVKEFLKTHEVGDFQGIFNKEAGEFFINDINSFKVLKSGEKTPDSIKAERQVIEWLIILGAEAKDLL